MAGNPSEPVTRRFVCRQRGSADPGHRLGLAARSDIRDARSLETADLFAALRRNWLAQIGGDDHAHRLKPRQRLGPCAHSSFRYVLAISVGEDLRWPLRQARRYSQRTLCPEPDISRRDEAKRSQRKPGLVSSTFHARDGSSRDHHPPRSPGHSHRRLRRTRETTPCARSPLVRRSA